MDTPRSHWKPALGCAILAGLLFAWLIGSRLDLLNDEGIYLDGARRMLAGQEPYRDFFALTGPGVFWNLAAAFQFLGMTFTSARLILVIDLAVLTGGLFWLGAQLVSRRTSAILCFCFVSFLAGNMGMLKVTHRWDSSAVGLAAVVLFWAGWKNGRNALLAAAGAAAAYAAWITPSMLALPAAMTGWLLFQSMERRRAIPFLAGGAAISAAAGLWLAAHGSLIPMIEHLLWTSRNYSEANRVGYGSIPGGYGGVFDDAAGFDILVRGFILIFVALPAFLPPVALGWLVPRYRKVAPAPLFLACAAGFFVSSLPRWDLDHLEYVEPLFLVLAGGLLAHAAPARVTAIAGVVFAAVATLFLGNAVAGRLKLQSLETKRGTIHGTPLELEQVKTLLDPLPGGDGVFVYPYLPTLYFFTEATNPTRYSFIQPGMMTEEDEQILLADLRKRPPEWVIYNDLPISEFLRVFPSSNKNRLRLDHIESWLKANYGPAAGVPEKRGIALWRAVPNAVAIAQ